MMQKLASVTLDALAKTQKMAKQKFRPTRPGGFSGAKAYIRYVEVLKKRRNAVGRTFCDAITLCPPGELIMQLTRSFLRLTCVASMALPAEVITDGHLLTTHFRIDPTT
jgi:hypothetical protein